MVWWLRVSSWAHVSSFLLEQLASLLGSQYFFTRSPFFRVSSGLKSNLRGAQPIFSFYWKFFGGASASPSSNCALCTWSQKTYNWVSCPFNTSPSESVEVSMSLSYFSWVRLSVSLHGVCFIFFFFLFFVLSFIVCLARLSYKGREKSFRPHSGSYGQIWLEFFSTLRSQLCDSSRPSQQADSSWFRDMEWIGLCLLNVGWIITQVQLTFLFRRRSNIMKQR